MKIVAPYCPKKNRAIQATNKNTKKIVTKMTKLHKDWPEKMLFALTTYKDDNENVNWRAMPLLVHGTTTVGAYGG